MEKPEQETKENKPIILKEIPDKVLAMSNKDFFAYACRNIKTRIVFNPTSKRYLDIPNSGINHTVYLSRARGLKKEAQRAATLAIAKILSKAKVGKPTIKDGTIAEHYRTDFVYKGKSYTGEAFVKVREITRDGKNKRRDFYHHKLIQFEIDEGRGPRGHKSQEAPIIASPLPAFKDKPYPTNGEKSRDIPTIELEPLNDISEAEMQRLTQSDDRGTLFELKNTLKERFKGKLIENKDTGNHILITNRGIKKSVQPYKRIIANQETRLGLFYIDQILQNAVHYDDPEINIRTQITKTSRISRMSIYTLLTIS